MNGKNGIFARFDGVAILGFTSKKERAFLLTKEFARVGIIDYRVQWQFPNPFDEMMIRAIHSKNGAMCCVNYFNSTFGHYRLIKQALGLNFNSILICEDDIRFRRNLDEIADILNDLPNNYDIALLDSFPPLKFVRDPEWRTHCGATPATQHWMKFENMRSAGCYALSRRGMEALVDTFESGDKKRLIDQYFRISRIHDKVNAYFATPNAARQIPMGGSNSSDENLLPSYAAMGADVADFGFQGAMI